MPVVWFLRENKTCVLNSSLICWSTRQHYLAYYIFFPGIFLQEISIFIIDKLSWPFSVYLFGRQAHIQMQTQGRIYGVHQGRQTKGAKQKSTTVNRKRIKRSKWGRNRKLNNPKNTAIALQLHTDWRNLSNISGKPQNWKTNLTMLFKGGGGWGRLWLVMWWVL